jgi:penicillin-binding protein 2
MTEGRTRTRMKVLAFLSVIMFAALTTRLWFLQVLASEQFSNLAKDQQVRLVPIEPLRGQILDRTGKVLVGNRPSTVVLVDQKGMKGRGDEVLYRLSTLLKVPVTDMLERLNSVKYLPYQPVPVAEDVSKEAVFYIEEHKVDFPGVSYEVDPIRDYPNGSLAAQMLGYILPVSEEQLKQPEFRDALPGELVGYAGIESTYQQSLQGIRGEREIQVNAQGTVLNENFGMKPPVPGDNVVLAIDQRIQQIAEQNLALAIDLAHHTADRTSGKFLKAPGGAVIVMDPKTGRVLALASNPTFDPSVFVGGLSKKEFGQLNRTGANFPLVDKAIQGLYPAGSTFKPFVAAAALHDGLAKMSGRYNCPSGYSAPVDPHHHVFQNWSTLNYGAISIPQALVISCDTVFYQFGYNFWLKYHRSGDRRELFQRDLDQMGFGRKTGIDLPAEQAGLVPTKAYVDKLYESNPRFYGNCFKNSLGKMACHPLGWLPGDSIELSIGQGYVSVTPMQLAVAYSAIANGGTLYAPRVAYKITSADGRLVRTIQPRVMGKLPISKRQVDFLRRALIGVTTQGTAATAFEGFPLDKIPVAGKTGTADIIPKQPYSWFAGMAPANDPRYVVIGMIEQGGHGATTAAPMVRRIFEQLFGLAAGGLKAGQVAD